MYIYIYILHNINVTIDILIHLNTYYVISLILYCIFITLVDTR